MTKEAVCRRRPGGGFFPVSSREDPIERQTTRTQLRRGKNTIKIKGRNLTGKKDKQPSYYPRSPPNGKGKTEHIDLPPFPSSANRRGWLSPIMLLIGHHYAVEIRHLSERREAVSSQQCKAKSRSCLSLPSVKATNKIK